MLPVKKDQSKRNNKQNSNLLNRLFRKKSRSAEGGKTRNPHTALWLVLVFVIGLSLLLYPTVSDWWNSFHQSRAVLAYADTVSNMDEQAYESLWMDAVAYNEKLAKTGCLWLMTEEETEEYENTLRITDSGIMAYIDIPKINCTLPIYHGTEESILQTAVGHLSGTSLPVGGKNTHCVISGHRGLPSAKLFTDLDKLVEDDEFTIRTLDEILTYEVDQILIVEPTDLSALTIEPDQDYCTLVTCTPYGINTHRLLVRGHRIDTRNASSVRVTADALQVNSTVVAIVIAIPMLAVLVIVSLVSTPGRSKNPDKKNKADSKKKRRFRRK